MQKIIILALLLALLFTLSASARVGSDFIAWDWGGFAAEGIFLCPASGHIDNQTGNWIRDWTNPLAPIFPDLVTDC